MLLCARTVTSAAMLIMGASALLPGLSAAEEDKSDAEAGKAIAVERTRGNCIACHQFEGGESPGNIGPALIVMKARYPDAKVLRAQIWDATAANPLSPMPPFGKHEILSEDEIDQVVAFVLTL